MDRLELYGELDKYMHLVDRLREALYWYAEPHGNPTCIHPCCIDNGARARSALNFLGNREVVHGTDANGSPVVEIVRK